MAPPCRLLVRVLLPLAVMGLSTASRGAGLNEDLAELVLPTNTLTLGVAAWHSQSRALGKWQAYGQSSPGLLLGADWRGGGYDTGDARRWELQLENPTLNTRRLSFAYRDQGVFGLRLSHEALPFLISDSYQTPMQGAGTERLVLPAGFTARTAIGPSVLPALGGQFASHQLGSQRKQTELALSRELNEAWQLRGSVGHELKWGSKATGASAGTAGGSAMILPEKIHATTDQFNLALEYAAERRHLQLSYYGSLYRNQVDSLRYQNPFSAGQLENRLGVAPDNQLHQWKLDGGLNLGSTTRISASMAYGRMTQNEAFLPYSTNPVVVSLPQSSLNGLVVNETANLRLSSRPWRDLSLRAGYQYDSRDNRTPINRYTRSNYEVGSVGTYTNTPHSRSRHKAYVEADYALRRGTQLLVGVEQGSIRRYCRDVLQPCTEVESSKELSLRSEWRQQMGERVSGKLAYTQSQRRADAYRTLAGGHDLDGMAKFYLANRDRSQWRATVNVQASDALALSARVDLNQDDYKQSRFGLREASSRNYYLEASLAINDDLSVYAYFNRDHIRSRLEGRYSTTIVPGVELPNNEWAVRMKDVDDAVGLGFKHLGLMSGMLELSTDLALMEVRSSYDVKGGGCTSSACNGNLPSALPDVSTRLLSLRAEGRYQMDRDSAWRALALLNHRTARDYAYEGITATSSTRLLGTNETPMVLDGVYLGLSYIRSFR